jgi:hypothetical protein
VTIQVARAQADNKAIELEQKRMAQKHNRSSSLHSSKGQHRVVGSSSKAKRDHKNE